MKVAALRGALSDRARDGRLHVVETFVDGDTPKTKAALEVLSAATTSDKVLVVLGRDDQVSWLSLRNLPTVHLIAADQLNTYDVLVADEVVFTTEGLTEFLHGVPASIVKALDAAEDLDEDEADEDETDEDETDEDETEDDTDEEVEQ